MQNRGVIVAHDLSSERLKLVEENCARLGADRQIALPGALES